MHDQQLIDKFHKLVESKKVINSQIKILEKHYVIEFAKSKGLSKGDMVKTPSGQIGFLMFSEYLSYDKIDFWLKDIKKDGTQSLNNISTYCKFEDLKLVKKVIDVQ